MGLISSMTINWGLWHLFIRQQSNNKCMFFIYFFFFGGREKEGLISFMTINWVIKWVFVHETAIQQQKHNELSGDWNFFI